MLPNRLNSTAQYLSQSSKKKKGGRGHRRQSFEAFYFSVPKTDCGSKKFLHLKVYINYMSCNFPKSQNEMFCIGQKICLSNISYLHKATECHGY